MSMKAMAVAATVLTSTLALAQERAPRAAGPTKNPL